MLNNRMLITYFKDSLTLSRYRSGLANLYLENFIVGLESQDYRRFTIRRHVRVVVHFADWGRGGRTGARRRSAPRGCHALAGGGAAMLTNSVKTYLSVRRALGFKLRASRSTYGAMRISQLGGKGTARPLPPHHVQLQVHRLRHSPGLWGVRYLQEPRHPARA
jgi:hypothetical protein